MLAALLSLFVAASSLPPPAMAGSCAGDRAAFEHRLDQVWSEASMLLGVYETLVRGGWRLGMAHVNLIARWQLHSQFLAQVASALATNDPVTHSGLSDSLRPTWSQAWRLRGDIQPEGARAFEADLPTLVHEILSGLRICQGVRSVSLDPCLLFGTEEVDQREACIGAVLEYGFALAGRCEPEIVKHAIQVAGLPDGAHLLVETFCQAVTRQEPASCEELRSLSDNDRRACQIMAGAGREVCQASEDPTKIQNCLNKIRERDFARGLEPRMPESFVEFVGLGASTALLALRFPGEACSDLVREALRLKTGLVFGLSPLPW